MAERIDHMRYLPGMEQIDSDLMERVLGAMDAYDYERYTDGDVRRALARENRTGRRILRRCFPPLPPRTWRRWPSWPGRKPVSISATR